MGADAATDSLTPTASPIDLATRVKDSARAIGFDLVGIAPAVRPGGFEALSDWLAHGFQGEMAYLSRREQAYADPALVMSGVRSVVMLAVNYQCEEPQPVAPLQGRIARYALNERDYHDLLRERLGRLAAVLHREAPGCRTRGVVDTAPLLERDFARLAGLGWFGKNTMLIDKRQGSFTFLAALLTDAELAADQPHHTSHCGTCTRCLEACPTDAFVSPYVLDARRCISYLTIELKGPIPAELRPGMGDWLFGCDVCQDVCPWNKKSIRSTDPDFLPAHDRSAQDLVELLALSEDEFERRFGHTPLARPDRTGLQRNAAITLGNSRDDTAVPALTAALGHDDPIVRGAAAWALGHIGTAPALAALNSRRTLEDNATVLDEIAAALSVGQAIA